MRRLRFGALVLLAFLIAVNNSSASHHEPDFKTLDSLALLLKGFDATEEKDHNRAIELYTRVIHSADLSAKQLSNAHRARGDAYFHKGFLELAIRDYAHALKLNPHNAAAYTNRGNVRTRQGRFGDALDDLDSAINLDPHDALAFQNRGNVHFFSGRFDKASSDYRRSLGLKPSDLFSAIWLYLAKSRSGSDGRTDLLSQSKGMDLGAWPGPVVSLYLDDISTKELVEIAHRHTGNEKQEMISEAYFYGGEYHLVRQENKAAVAMFRRVIEQDVTNLVEFIGAKVELSRLKR